MDFVDVLFDQWMRIKLHEDNLCSFFSLSDFPMLIEDTHIVSIRRPSSRILHNSIVCPHRLIGNRMIIIRMNIFYYHTTKFTRKLKTRSPGSIDSNLATSVSTAGIGGTFSGSVYPSTKSCFVIIRKMFFVFMRMANLFL